MSQISLPTPRFTLLAAAAVLPAVAALVAVARPAPTRPVPSAIADGTAMLGRLPVAFVPNLGQWEHPAQYVARIGPMTMFLEEKGWTLTLVERATAQAEGETAREDARARGVAVRMTFAAASAPTLIAEDAQTGRHHYFLGNDPSKWRTEVPLYTSVRYRDVQPGVDVRAREHDGHFEYDLLLKPDAELEPVEIAVEGIERMHVDEQGALVMETRLGPVRMPPPLSWEEEPSGEKCVVTCRYVLRGKDRFGFEVPGRRRGWALVVDPGLVWSTFLGGANNESVQALALDAQGAATVAGVTGSTGFPSTPGAFDTSFNGGTQDAFVARLSPTGSSLVYATFLGGMGDDLVRALAHDAQGEVTVAGWTGSTDFPTTPGAFDTSFSGGTQDGFVTRLSPTGSSLVYSTLLGGNANDLAYAVALDAQGATTVVGHTYSTDFPTTPGAFATSFNGGMHDAFVTRLSATGSSLVYSTFLGGSNPEWAHALALDAQGAATVAGLTYSVNFPTTLGAFDTSHSGGYADAFVTRLSPTGSSLVYSTFLGGAGVDLPWALALDAQGAATVVGGTFSADFPTTPGAFDTSYNGGGGDAFVTRLSPTGSSLVYSTFLGGAVMEEATAVALDARGAATVAGRTNSADFPTTPGAFDTSHNGQYDAFVTRLSPTGSSLDYSTFFGGTNTDRAYALALDAQSAATAVGETASTDFPTTSGAFATNHSGGSDAFITRFDLLPTGVAAFGRSSAGCAGALPISVTSMPRVGNGNFALTCGNAPPTTSGLLALTRNRFVSPVVVLGAEIWVDPTLVFIQLPANSNNVGASEVSLPIPNGPWLRGTRLFAQFFWAGPSSPPPCPPQGLSASNALEFTVQP